MSGSGGGFLVKTLPLEDSTGVGSGFFFFSEAKTIITLFNNFPEIILNW